MILAEMVAADEGLFICDMMETYHIADYETYKCGFVATLAAGLREDSRIRMKLAGTKVTSELAVLSLIYDCVHWIQWSQTKDGQKNRNKPESLHDKLLGLDKPKDGSREIKGFASGKDFDDYRKQLLGGEK